MGDRTSFQITIYECAPDKVADVLGILDDYGLGTDWVTDHASSPHTELVLGQQYNTHEVTCGSAGEIAGSLNTVGATYECWEDPAYEWLGEYHAYIPGLGHFSGECDANGTVQVISSTLIRLANEARSLEELRLQIAAVTGVAWEEALVPLRALEPRTVRIITEEA